MIKCARCEETIEREILERMLPITDLEDVVCSTCTSQEYAEGGFIHSLAEVLFGIDEEWTY
jgi:hypothetical protein